MNRLLVASGVCISALWGGITWMSYGLPSSLCGVIDRLTVYAFSGEVRRMANGFHYDIQNSEMPTLAFLLVFYVIFVLTFFLIIKVEKNAPDRRGLMIILFFSVLFRLIAWPGVLIHENDIYRYLWDGKTAAHHINPYKYAPGDLWMYERDIREDYYDGFTGSYYRARNFSEADRKNLGRLIDLRGQNPAFFERISYKEVATIYPPAAQGVFTTSVMIRPDSVLVMKLLFVFFDFGVLLLLVALLEHFRKNPALVIVYGWSPLVVREFANAGHYDAVAVFFMLMSVWLFLKKKSLLSAGALALAVLTKFFAGVLLPLLGRRFKRYEFIFFAVLIVILYTPYVFLNDTGVTQLFSGLGDYGRDWAYNAGIYSVVYALMNAFSPGLTVSLIPSKAVVFGLYALVLLGLALKRNKNDWDLLHRCFCALAALFIFSPVGDPWYFCWVIPFLCFFPYRSWILLSGLLELSYINFRGDLALPQQDVLGISAVTGAIYFPFFAYLVWEWFKRPYIFLQQEQSGEEKV